MAAQHIFVTAAGTGNTFRQVYQPIKGVRTFAGQQVTLSCYMNADGPRTVTMQLAQIFGTGGSPSASIFNNNNVNVTTTPQRFTFSVTLGSLAGKTLGSNNDDTLRVAFALPVATIMSISIWDVQLELGPVATEYDRKSFDREFSDCLPYYEKSFSYAVAPAQNAGTTGAVTFSSAVGASAAMIGPKVGFAARKRAAPTLTLYNPSAANGQARNSTLGTDCSSTATTRLSDSGFGISLTTPAATVAGHQIDFHWAAEAEL